MIYSIKIIPGNPEAVKPPKFNIFVEEVSEEGIKSMADLNEKLVAQLNMHLSEMPIEINSLFDPVDESILFDKPNTCPFCSK